MIPQQTSRILSRRILKYASVIVRHHNFDGEVMSKTQLSMILREDESHNYILAYSNVGFRFSSGLGAIGPCALFPRLFLHWNVWSAKDITPESLSLFCLLEPKLDVLVIGKGDADAKVDNSIYRFLRSKNINMEILPTDQACATFNFLNADRRAVAAAMIPPTNIPDEYDESLSMLKFTNDPSVEEEHDKEYDKMLKLYNENGALDMRSSLKAQQQAESEKMLADKRNDNKTEVGKITDSKQNKDDR